MSILEIPFILSAESPLNSADCLSAGLVARALLQMSDREFRLGNNSRSLELHSAAHELLRVSCQIFDLLRISSAGGAEISAQFSGTMAEGAALRAKAAQQK